jgi:hypothetical protein
MKVLQTFALPLGYGTRGGSRRSDRLSHFGGYINRPVQVRVPGGRNLSISSAAEETPP